MKVFRYIIWIGLLLIPFLSFGQVDSDATELAKAQSLAKNLQLSADQTKPFLSIIKQHGKKSVKALELHSDNLPMLRKSLKKIQLSQDSEVEVVLSESQYEDYLVEIKKDRVQRRREFLKNSRLKDE